jgi:hypothetical protein
MDEDEMRCGEAFISNQDRWELIQTRVAELVGTCLLTGAVVAVMEQRDVPAHVT